ncbi:MAG TPA: GNAT family N-acetyltransferase [Pseudonocardiaceae bacterium]|nr:GNAT family N-acetyltransferase [Pseudonocardiaceae bacterium]
MPDAVIRPYRPADRDAVYDICLRTADSGGDATALYRDPELVGDLFAGPYLLLAPEFAFVLDDGERAVGYVLGVPDTVRFAKAFRTEWLPLVGARNPAPTSEPRDRDEEMAKLLHNPEGMIVPELADYPAHLHINLLPSHQRAGHGRKMIFTLLDALHNAGIAQVYLGTRTDNKAAAAFYDRLGFHHIDVAEGGPITFLGRSTDLSG